jgi:hypothetical protein
MKQNFIDLYLHNSSAIYLLAAILFYAIFLNPLIHVFFIKQKKFRLVNQFEKIVAEENLGNFGSNNICSLCKSTRVSKELFGEAPANIKYKLFFPIEENITQYYVLRCAVCNKIHYKGRD